MFMIYQTNIFWYQRQGRHFLNLRINEASKSFYVFLTQLAERNSFKINQIKPFSHQSRFFITLFPIWLLFPQICPLFFPPYPTWNASLVIIFKIVSSTFNALNPFSSVSPISSHLLFYSIIYLLILFIICFPPL